MIRVKVVKVMQDYDNDNKHIDNYLDIKDINNNIFFQFIHCTWIIRKLTKMLSVITQNSMFR